MPAAAFFTLSLTLPILNKEGVYLIYKTRSYIPGRSSPLTDSVC